MFTCLQSLPLSQTGPRRPETPPDPDVVIRDLLLVDSAVPAPLIIRSLERISGIEHFRDLRNSRRRAA